MPVADGGVLLRLDDAWPPGVLGLQSVDVRKWGPRLRYCAPAALVDAFAREVAPQLDAFTLYGSGDFHFLTGVLLRRALGPEPLTVVSFDNHPDWDVRPPSCSCGGWTARAARLPGVRRVSVWGCGNFELRLPARLFADRRSLAAGRLEVHAWRERQPPSVCARFGCIDAATWRGRFERFCDGLSDTPVYVTVDLDCVCEAVANWETGLFSAEDVAWALGVLRRRTRVAGGDVCGAWSPPVHARLGQRLASAWDHPTLPRPDPEAARDANVRALETIWPALTSR